MTIPPEDRARRRAAKLFNERLPLVATVLNASCIGVLAAAIIVPGVADAGLRPGIAVWLLIAAALHLMAQAILSLYRSED